jgi:hypothetical protein
VSFVANQPFLTDIKTLRERARQHIENGAGILAVEEEHADDLVSMLEKMG